MRLWAEHHLHTADQSIRKGALVEAQDHLRKYLSVRPSDAKVHLRLARAARRAGDYEQAKASRKTCSQLDPSLDGEVVLEGLLSLIQRGEEPATPEQQAYLAERHPDAKILILEAFAQGFLQAGRLPSALDCLNSLLAEQPDHYQGRLLRGFLYEMFHLDDEALADYQQAVEVNAGGAKGRLGLGRVLYRLGRVREARSEFERLRQLQPSEPEIMLYLARCQVDANQMEEAKQTLDTLLADRPDSIPALMERGRIAFAQGETTEAERLLHKAVAPADAARDEPDFQNVLDRCDAYFQLHLYQQAQGKRAAAQDSIAQADELQADLRRATDLTEELSKNPRDASKHCERGLILLHLGHQQQGIDELKVALSLDPTQERARAALANLGQKKPLR
jgi:tetratricopeptide (TPR) repeat protein